MANIIRLFLFLFLVNFVFAQSKSKLKKNSDFIIEEDSKQTKSNSDSIIEDDLYKTKTNPDFVIEDDSNQKKSNSDFVIEDDSSSKKKKNAWKEFVNYYNKHFKLTFGTASGYYNSGPRVYSYINLNWEQTFFKFWTLKFNGEALHSYSQIKLEPDNSLPPDLQQKTANLLTYTDNSLASPIDWSRTFVLRETYTQFDITQYARLVAGRKVVTWGQFDILSPVDIALPIRATSGGLAVSKIANRIPQDVAILSIFPTSKIELELYYFPYVTIDQSVKKTFAKFTEKAIFLTVPQLSSEADNNYNKTYGNTYLTNNSNDPFLTKTGYYNTPTGAASVQKTIQVPPPLFNAYDNIYNLAKSWQVAARFMYYHDNFIMGVTYSYLYNTLSPANIERIYYSPSGIPNVPDFVNYKSTPQLLRTHNLGYELAIPIKRWVIKAEVAANFSISTMNLQVSSLFANLTGQSAGKPVSPDLLKAAQELHDFVIQKNEGYFAYLQYAQLIYAMGVEVDERRWFGTLQVIRLDNVYWGNAKKLQELSEKYEALNRSKPSSLIPVVPLINIGWYSVASKKGMLGLAGGFLVVGLGGSLYYLHKFFDDSFTVGGSFDVLRINADRLAESAGTKIANSWVIGGKILFSYSL